MRQVTPEEYWRRRDEDDKWRQSVDTRLDRLDEMAKVMITLGKWAVGLLATTAATTVADFLIRGGIR